MSVTEPLAAPAASASRVSGQRNPLASEDEALAGDDHRGRGGTPVTATRDARPQQVADAGLDGEPRRGVDDADQNQPPAVDRRWQTWWLHGQAVAAVGVVRVRRPTGTRTPLRRMGSRGWSTSRYTDS
jgi:hypothetical protein